LGAVIETPVQFGDGLLNIGKASIAKTEKRSRMSATSIPKMEILKTLNPEFVIIPVKGW
jgi:hypothetical protein